MLMIADVQPVAVAAVIFVPPHTQKWCLELFLQSLTLSYATGFDKLEFLMKKVPLKNSKVPMVSELQVHNSFPLGKRKEHKVGLKTVRSIIYLVRNFGETNNEK